ncbi:hypothetical protein AA105894_1672 [Asaia spathodeae NBRC 105894]|nr:hypothetical protein AA105894_1672 [Asaia spathodeae NBRC 105894]
MGWSENGWVCTNGHAMIRFARSDYATVWSRPDGRVTQNGDETDVTIPIPPLKGRGGQAHTTFADDAQTLLGIAQFYKGTLSIKATPLPTPGQPSITTPAMAAEMDWRPFEMTLPVAPNHVPWSRVHALRFRSVEASENSFRIVGDLHAQ